MLNNRYHPAAFSDEEDDSSVATPMYSDGEITELKFCFLPHVCSLTGRRLWLEKAYRTKERYYSTFGTHPGHEVTYTQWADKHEYIVWKLKNS